MNYKFIDLQCKVLSVLAFTPECKFSEKELEYYNQILYSSSLSDKEIKYLLKYTKAPPSYKNLLIELAKIPKQISFLILKNAYLISRISEGVQDDQKKILKEIAHVIKIPKNRFIEVEQIFKYTYKLYKLEDKLLNN